MSTTEHDRSTAALQELRSRIVGTVAAPGEPGYELATPWNLTVTSKPAAVVAVTGVTDIQTVLDTARKHGLRAAVQATGHGALRHDADVLTIHTGALRHIEIDDRTRTAHVGAGVLAHELSSAAAKFGLAPLLGTAATVGVVGYMSGGGVGPLVSTFGLSSDYVRRLEVVTGDGRHLFAGPEENADLYWALRGGRAVSVGVIASIEVELIALSHVYAGALYFDAVHVADITQAWAAWSADLPSEATTSIALVQIPDTPFAPPAIAGRYCAAVRYVSPAPAQRAEALLAPIRRIAEPLLDTVTTIPYPQLPTVFDEPPAPTPVHTDHALLDSLPTQAVDALIAASGPAATCKLTVVELRRLGGSLALVPTHSSAFCHRDAGYSLSITAVVHGDVGLVRDAADRVRTALSPWTLPGMLANFCDANDAEQLDRAYDASTLERLRSVADIYNPGRVLIPR